MQRIFYLVMLVLSGAILSLCGDSLAGTTGKITGQVTDAQGDPLPGVAVQIEGTRRGTETDVEGFYFLLSIEPGKHALVASMVGYESQRLEDVVVSSDFTSNGSFELRELPIAQQEIVVEAQRGSAQWGMLSAKANTPPVEPDKTTSMYLVRAGDIEALPIVRQMEEFIELQAGVAIDEVGDEITIRAGDPEDVAYYLDGVPIPSTDHVKTRVYRDFNRLAIQEMTVVIGGMNAEYGNAQGGVVSVVMREGERSYGGLVDYQFTPPGKKHCGENVYDSPIHRGQNRWEDPGWAAETVTLSDGRQVSAHRRLDYTGVAGHFLEGNLSGPLLKDWSFFLSGRWQREVSVFPGPHLATPFNMNSLLIGYPLGLPMVLNRPGMFETATVDLKSGDLMVFTSDGVEEAQDDKEELYGESRLRNMILNCGKQNLSAEIVRDRILNDVLRYIGDAPRTDDVTVVVLKMH